MEAARLSGALGLLHLRRRVEIWSTITQVPSLPDAEISLVFRTHGRPNSIRGANFLCFPGNVATSHVKKPGAALTVL